MSVFDVIDEIDEFEAPWGKKVVVREIEYGGGLRMLQLRIQEGSRFTIMELDAATATRLGEAILPWAERKKPPV